MVYYIPMYTCTSIWFILVATEVTTYIPTYLHVGSMYVDAFHHHYTVQQHHDA